jgi:hypothetical protein
MELKVGDRVKHKRHGGEKEMKYMDNKYGADPEFGLVNAKGEMIHANTYFKGTSTLLGLDGNSRTGEMRPRPHNNILFVVADIKNILSEGYKQNTFDGVEFRACSSDAQAIGGHIHIELLGKCKTNIFQQELVARLDKVLFDCIENLLGDKKGMARRQSSGYGHRGQYNRPPYGIEYRPCSSWLISPEVATIFLGMSKMVYESQVLDLPTYLSSEKTFLTLLSHKSEYSEDVKVAIELVCNFLAKKEMVDWNTDVLKNWGVRNE